VRFERAPFDHPSICIPVGHAESAPGVPQLDPTSDSRSSALDVWALVPASGREGNTVLLQTFEEFLEGVGSQGVPRACHIGELSAVAKEVFTTFHARSSPGGTEGQPTRDSAWSPRDRRSTRGRAARPRRR
jgi:hypothetical protein